MRALLTSLAVVVGILAVPAPTLAANEVGGDASVIAPSPFPSPALPPTPDVIRPVPVPGPVLAPTVIHHPAPVASPDPMPTPWNPPLDFCPSPNDWTTMDGECWPSGVYAFIAPPGWKVGDPIPPWRPVRQPAS